MSRKAGVPSRVVGVATLIGLLILGSEGCYWNHGRNPQAASASTSKVEGRGLALKNFAADGVIPLPEQIRWALFELQSTAVGYVAFSTKLFRIDMEAAEGRVACDFSQPGSPQGTITGLACGPGLRIWIVLNRQQLITSQDGGGTWRTVELGSGAEVRGISVAGDRVCVLGGLNPANSRGGGPRNTHAEIWFIDSGTLIAVPHRIGRKGDSYSKAVRLRTGKLLLAGESGAILLNSDGSEWRYVDLGANCPRDDIGFVGAASLANYGEAVWCSTREQRMIMSNDGGATWRSASLAVHPEDPAISHFSAMHFANEQNGLAVGDNDVLYETENGAVSWEAVSQSNDIYALGFVDDTLGYVVSGRDVIRVRAN